MAAMTSPDQKEPRALHLLPVCQPTTVGGTVQNRVSALAARPGGTQSCLPVGPKGSEEEADVVRARAQVLIKTADWHRRRMARWVRAGLSRSPSHPDVASAAAGNGGGIRASRSGEASTAAPPRWCAIQVVVHRTLGLRNPCVAAMCLSYSACSPGRSTSSSNSVQFLAASSMLQNPGGTLTGVDVQRLCDACQRSLRSAVEGVAWPGGGLTGRVVVWVGAEDQLDLAGDKEAPSLAAAIDRSAPRFHTLILHPLCTLTVSTNNYPFRTDGGIMERPNWSVS